MTARLYLSPPHMGANELPLLQGAFRSNWIAPLGPEVDAFEREFAEAIGVAHAAALSSGTAGIHLALQLLGVQPGDTVLCSALTFVASASPIRWMGAEPVFVDCSRDTWNLDPALVAEEIETASRKGRTPKAVVAVDIYGQAADLDPIGAVCDRHQVAVIEDAAEALGATYRGRSAGSLGRIGVFSFNGNKIITTSGGGMLVSSEEALVSRARFLAQQARDPAPHYEHSVLGNNYRMSNLLAAVGRGQLRVLPHRVRRRREIFEAYRKALAGVPGIEFMPEAPYGQATRWLTVILVNPSEFGASREDVRQRLESLDIESRPVWKPMHLQPVFRDCRVIGGSVAADLFDRGLCLPSGTQMTDGDVTRVVDGLLAARQRSIPRSAPAVARPPSSVLAVPKPDSTPRSEGAHQDRQADRRVERRSAHVDRRSGGQRLLTSRTRVAVDLVTMTAAFALAYTLRFDFQVPPEWLLRAVAQLPLVVAVELVALYTTGILSFVWRYVGMSEVPAFGRAAAGSAAVLAVLRLFLPERMADLRIPLSIIVINAVLAFGGLLGVRVLRRALAERQLRERRAGGTHLERTPTLLVGAGAAGIMAVREMQSQGHGLELRGFVDDDSFKQGTVIAGLKVLGTTEDLPRLVPELGIQQVVITIAEAPEAHFQRIARICQRIPVRTQRVPALFDLLQGKVSIATLREVRAEELLHRDAVALEENDLEEFLGGKVVMVTGAGGSIGAELARQAARFAPARLVLLERAEPALYTVDRSLREMWPERAIVPVVGDVGDRERMRAVFRAYRPQVVVHAAAHKHVPLMETNAAEAVKNNVFGTLTLGEVAGESGTESFILISSDKAVRPSSVMGAAKRVAELVALDLGQRFPTRYVAVRFGNVLGSAGSVIPLFREQIARGGPVTVTHPEMKRYFMTIPEAAVLTLQAGAMGKGGEIFLLDMGEPVLIVDLAKRLIELSARTDGKHVDVVFTGVRPGEKLSEELQYRSEPIDRTRHPKINIGKITGVPPSDLATALRRLRELLAEGDNGDIRAFLGTFLPEARLNGDGNVVDRPAGEGVQPSLVGSGNV